MLPTSDDKFLPDLVTKATVTQNTSPTTLAEKDPSDYSMPYELKVITNQLMLTTIDVGDEL